MKGSCFRQVKGDSLMDWGAASAEQENLVVAVKKGFRISYNRTWLGSPAVNGNKNESCLVHVKLVRFITNSWWWNAIGFWVYYSPCVLNFKKGNSEVLSYIFYIFDMSICVVTLIQFFKALKIFSVHRRKVSFILKFPLKLNIWYVINSLESLSDKVTTASGLSAASCPSINGSSPEFCLAGEGLGAGTGTERTSARAPSEGVTLPTASSQFDIVPVLLFQFISGLGIRTNCSCPSVHTKVYVLVGVWVNNSK